MRPRNPWPLRLSVPPSIGRSLQNPERIVTKVGYVCPHEPNRMLWADLDGEETKTLALALFSCARKLMQEDSNNAPIKVFVEYSEYLESPYTDDGGNIHLQTFDRAGNVIDISLLRIEGGDAQVVQSFLTALQRALDKAREIHGLL